MILEGASIHGSSHKAYNVANQDAYRIGRIHDYSVAIVCDGVSLKLDHTFSNSEWAARFCCNYSFSYLQEHLNKNESFEKIAERLQVCFDETEKALRIYLEGRGVQYWDCQTTLLIIVYYKGRFACAMAGDGGAVFQKRDGKFFVIVTKEKQSSLVEPISAREGWCFSCYDSKDDPVCSFILATDGVFDQLVHFSEGTPLLNQDLLEQFLNLSKVPQKRRTTALKKILQDVNSHDDKTAVVMMDKKEQYSL